MPLHSWLPRAHPVAPSHLSALMSGVMIKLALYGLVRVLFQWAAQLVIGPVPDGQTVNMHPVVFACWFGMLATALNLIPFGQFDGGHIVYAVFGDRPAQRVSALAVSVSA